MIRSSNRMRQALALLLCCVSVPGAPAQTPGPTGFPSGPAAPKGAPNVLIIMTDDVGFGASSTFGGPVATPTLDALAARGARFSRFQTTSVCAATRAALLTGRNPHSVATGSVPEMATPYAGYNSAIPPSAASFAKILSLNGYATAMIGKHHNMPVWEDNPAGPATHMPLGFGFDYFYGFVGASTSQYAPALRENLNAVDPDPNDSNYHLDRDLADHAIAWLRRKALFAPDKPFLLYYAPATLHAPVQAPPDWIRRFRGKFHQGWDLLRQQIYERQKKLGVIPANTTLAPMPPDTPKWDQLSPDQKRLAERYMEVYAAALAFCDDQIGRIIAELKRDGRLDDTLIFYIQGDNGASVEGGPDGAFSYTNRLNGIAETLAENLRRIDWIGGPKSAPVVPEGWTRATNAPFQWNKTIASHLGGTRNGLVVSWPGHVLAPGQIRFQFHDVIDIAPTIYEAAGISPPTQVNGVVQQPIEGVSMLYTLKKPVAPSPRREQYFETFGNMGLYQDGWLLSSRPASGGQSIYDKSDGTGVWELYDLRHDFSQSHDLAAREPQRVVALAQRFRVLATEHHVDPISRDVIGRVIALNRLNPVSQPGYYAFPNGRSRYGNWSFPQVSGRSWSIRATLKVLVGNGDGMIATQGGRFSGWGLLVQGGHATFLYRRRERDEDLVRVSDPDPLALGPHIVEMRFVTDTMSPGAGGQISLLVDHKEKARGRLLATVPFAFSEDAQIGRDYGTSLSADYRGPFVYPGTIAEVAIDTRVSRTASSDPNGYGEQK